MLIKRRVSSLLHIALLVVFFGVCLNSMGQFKKDNPLCTGVSCLTNSDCGVGCICGSGMCFRVIAKQHSRGK